MADGGAHARLQPDPARPLGPGIRRMDRGFRRPDRPQRPADRHRFFQRLCGRHTDLAGPLRGRLRPRAPACGGEGGLRRPRRAVLWLALSAVLLCDCRSRRRRSLRVGAGDLAGRELCGLPRRDPRHPAAPGNAAGRGRLPGRVRQCRPRPEWLPHRSAARRRAALARSQAMARGRADRPPGLQAAIRRPDSDRASGGRAVAHDRRGGSHRCGAGRRQLRAARQRHLARLRRTR